MTHTGAFRNHQPTHKANTALVDAICCVINKDETIVDIGAGLGIYVKALLKRGYNITGIDGTKHIQAITNGLIRRYDLVTRRPVRNKPYVRADVGLFLEVGEHIPRRYEDKMLNTVCNMPRHKMIVTWASPHQPGRGHVNCRTEVYIAQRFAVRGWYVNDDITTKMQDMCSIPHRKMLKRRLMFLEKRER